MRRNPARTIAWSSTIATRTTFTPLTPTLSPVGRGGALRGSRRAPSPGRRRLRLGLLSRPSPQPSPLWGEGERCAETGADYFHAPHPNPLPYGERGSVARTVNPPSEDEPVLSSPPKSSKRSRIPTRPWPVPGVAAGPLPLSLIVS